MPRTYKAILHGDRVEWIDTPPADHGPAEVEILLPGDAAMADGSAMAGPLDVLAESGGIVAIPDPLAWQRDCREDRFIPGRDA